MLRLKELREQQGIKQTELAAYLNVGQNTYSQCENCQRQTPVAVLIKLADYYDVSVDYLLGLTDEDRRYPRT